MFEQALTSNGQSGHARLCMAVFVFTKMNMYVNLKKLI